MRPVCGASDAPNSRLSHFLSRIINDYANIDEIETECRSGEEMKAAFERYNEESEEIRKTCKIISMDVKALYPSMEWSEITKSIKELIENSQTEIEQVDFMEVGKYLAVTMTKKDIEREISVSSGYIKQIYLKGYQVKMKMLLLASSLKSHLYFAVL